MEQYGKGDAPNGDGKRKPRVLVVDDHSDSARALSRLLGNAGYEVRVAHDVATALRLAAEKPFDLLVSDITLPDGTGLDLIRTLRRATPVKGIAVSGHSSEEAIRSSRAAGFSIHMVKPVDFTELRKTLDTLAAD
ncbi:MAG: sensor hybrid histidine kinase [Phycisphaerales bacterium]|nr:sensor hybrid histidine kinase [Phycisphaerales bacterium]